MLFNFANIGCDRSRLPFGLATVASLLVLSGCATVGERDGRQAVYVQSSPPGAKIYQTERDGSETLLGRTPSFVELKRRSRVELQLETVTGRKTVELQTKYRWGRSFWGNFALLTYAPIGWLVDFLSGTAWQIEDSELIPVELAAADRSAGAMKARLTRVAIAPPLARSLAASQWAAGRLEAAFAEDSAMNAARTVLPYESTLPVFLDENWDFNAPSSSPRGIWPRLQVTQIVRSQVEESPDGSLTLKTSFIEPDSLRKTPGPTVSLGHYKSDIFFRSSRWADYIPNTVGLDFVEDKIKVDTLGGGTVELKNEENDEWWATGLRYLSAINISSTTAERQSRTYGWRLNAVPTLRFSRKRLSAENLPAPTGSGFYEQSPVFIRSAAVVGYGAQFSYQFGRSDIYGDVIPIAQWSEINWRESGENKSSTRFNLAAQFEIGYRYVFDAGWLIRLFSRTSSENLDNWNDAFRSRTGGRGGAFYASNVVGGLTIAYHFQPQFSLESAQ